MQKTDHLNPIITKESAVSLSEVQGYKKCVTTLIDDEETVENLNAYKESVKKLLNIKSSILIDN